MTTQFASTAGSPRLARTTNLPASGRSSAYCLWARISTYADFVELCSLNNIGDGLFTGFEGDAGGNLNALAKAPDTTVTLWSDSRTTWNFLAQCAEPGAGTTSTVRTFSMTTAGVWTVHTTMAQTDDWVPDAFTWAANSAFITDANATIQVAGLKLWSAFKSEAVLRAEAFSLKPRHWQDLVFWNAGLLAASVGTDRSGNGGNFTTTGSPTDSTSDPGMPWQRRA